MKSLRLALFSALLMGSALASAQASGSTNSCTPGQVRTAYGCLDRLNCEMGYGSLDGRCIPGVLVHEGCEAGYTYLPMRVVKQTRLQSGAYTTSTGVCLPSFE